MRRPLPAKPTLADEDVPELLGLPDGISRWTGDRIGELRQKVRTGGIDPGMENLDKRLCRTIDILGARSQRAQEINVALTSVARLCENKSFRLYLLTKDHRGVGILKMGVKKLFVTHPVTRSLVEVDPLCVLDFYVDESCQRHGCGKALYAHMLQEERVRRPETLAIDRPSPKMLGFMKKHYGLSAFAPQVNNFVVFDRFFDRTSVTERGKLIRAASPVSCERNATPSAKKREARVVANTAGDVGLLGPSYTPHDAVLVAPSPLPAMPSIAAYAPLSPPPLSACAVGDPSYGGAGGPVWSGGYAAAAAAAAAAVAPSSPLQPFQLPQRRVRNARAPYLAVAPPPRLPSLSPVVGSHASHASCGDDKGMHGPAAASLLPPGCFSSRPTAVYSLPAIAVAPAMKVLRMSPITSPAPSPSAKAKTKEEGKGAITYIGMSPTSTVTGGSDRENSGGRPAELSPAAPPMRRDQRWYGLALASADDQKTPPTHAAPSPPAVLPSSGATYRRGAPYNIISNLP